MLIYFLENYINSRPMFKRLKSAMYTVTTQSEHTNNSGLQNLSGKFLKAAVIFQTSRQIETPTLSFTFSIIWARSYQFRVHSVKIHAPASFLVFLEKLWVLARECVPQSYCPFIVRTGQHVLVIRTPRHTTVHIEKQSLSQQDKGLTVFTGREM